MNAGGSVWAGEGWPLIPETRWPIHGPNGSDRAWGSARSWSMKHRPEIYKTLGPIELQKLAFEDQRALLAEMVPSNDEDTSREYEGKHGGFGEPVNISYSEENLGRLRPSPPPPKHPWQEGAHEEDELIEPEDFDVTNDGEEAPDEEEES